jgi:hypothetical protein
MMATKPLRGTLDVTVDDIVRGDRTPTPASEQANPPVASPTPPTSTQVSVPVDPLHVFLDRRLLDRLRSALNFCGRPTLGLSSQSDLVSAALQEYLTGLETRFNNGQPWPYVPKSKTGRKKK